MAANASSSSDRSVPKEGIDFDRVEETLIQPAIRGVKGAVLEGSTTVPIVEQGNIREDMFRELVIADIVIADLSIHNANVDELGIRHGLRPHATFLLRARREQSSRSICRPTGNLRYDAAQPETALQKLTAALEKTVASARIDSPVYRLLPNLRAPDADVLQRRATGVRSIPSTWRRPAGHRAGPAPAGPRITRVLVGPAGAAARWPRSVCDRRVVGRVGNLRVVARDPAGRHRGQPAVGHALPAARDGREPAGTSTWRGRRPPSSA